MLEMISIFTNIPRLDLWPRMRSILENVPCALEKKVKSCYRLGPMHHLRLCFLFNFLSWWSSHCCEWYIRVPHYYCATVSSVQFSSVTQSCPTLCYPMNRSTPGLPVHHQLPEFTQTHVLELVMLSSHLILHHPFLLLPSIFPSITVFSNESTLHIRWPKYWNFSLSISSSRRKTQDWSPL